MEIIAHRGAAAYELENSRAAIELARRQGADRVELDVRATKDGRPVVLHDAFLERTTTGKGRLRDFYWDELSRVRLANGEPLLLLEEALELVGRNTLIYVDVKEPDIAPAVAQLVEGIEGTIVGTSDRKALISAAAAAPGLKLALLVNGRTSPVREAAGAGAQYVHLCWEGYPDPVSMLTPSLFSLARSAGLAGSCGTRSGNGS